MFGFFKKMSMSIDYQSKNPCVECHLLCRFLMSVEWQHDICISSWFDVIAFAHNSWSILMPPLALKNLHSVKFSVWQTLVPVPWWVVGRILPWNLPLCDRRGLPWTISSWMFLFNCFREILRVSYSNIEMINSF